jgi:nitrogen fixation/metabolism regulation signal transduction histidine kinase
MAGKSGVHVVLQTSRSQSGRWVRLSILDEGSGFADHILKRAFEPYVTTKSKGTGLGLAVVKKIMDEHGGRVDIGNRFHEGRVTGAQVSLSFAVAI